MWKPTAKNIQLSKRKTTRGKKVSETEELDRVLRRPALSTRTSAARRTTQDPRPSRVQWTAPPGHRVSGWVRARRKSRRGLGASRRSTGPRPPRAHAAALTVALQDLVLEAAGVVDELLQAAFAQLPVARELVQHLLQLALHRHALIHAGDRGARLPGARGSAVVRPGPHRGRVLLLVPQGGGRRGKLKQGGRASRGAEGTPRSPCPPAPWRPGPAARARSAALPGAASRPGPLVRRVRPPPGGAADCFCFHGNRPMTWFSRAAPRAAVREGVEPPSPAEEAPRAVPSTGSARGAVGSQEASAGGGERRRSEGAGRTTREAVRERSGEGGASGAIGPRG